MTKLRLELKKKNGDVVVYEQDKVPASRVLDFWNIQEKL